MEEPEEEHEIEQLIDNLKSNLFYHGHPISREEAIKDLKLKAEKPEPEVESLMWQLYLEYEGDLKLREPFNPLRELELKSSGLTAPMPLTTAQLVQQMQALAAAGIGIGMVSEDQLVKLAAAMIPLCKWRCCCQRQSDIGSRIGCVYRVCGALRRFRNRLEN